MKINYRSYSPSFFILFTAVVMLLNGCNLNKGKAENKKAAQWVDPMIGTSGHGHTFPGATLPFGMVQLSPDTHTEGWDWCSGYHYSDSSIIGFSHTHLSGTGRGDLLDILVMPVTGEIQWEAGSRENPDSGYRSRFSHASENARPGYYSVYLEDYKIKVELTATRRAGIHRYTFEEDQPGSLIIDLFHSLKTDSVIQASVQKVNDSLIVGSRQTRGWGEPGEEYWVNHPVFFALRLSRPVASMQIMNDNVISTGGMKETGRMIKAAVQFRDDNSQPLLVKVGISAVDIEGALQNLDTEIPGWDFDEIKANAEKEWEQMLDRIGIKTVSEERKRTFYTAVYHSCIAPFTYSDVDNRYRGFDMKIHTTDGGLNYTGFSLWDTFRATHPFFTIVAPERIPDMIKSMLAQYVEYGLLPVWPLCASETNCMIGYHSVPVIADAYLKGITQFDGEKAYEAMRKSAMQDNFGIQYLKQVGYIPTDLDNKSVSKTLEYAYDDWCLAQMAKKLGKTGDAAYFLKRSGAYKEVFDSVSGFMRGRNADGSFAEPFDPTYSSYGRSDFIEGNAWQYSWFVPHDVTGLINLMGGDASFTEKLDELFTAVPSENENKPVDITGTIGEYAHGNEPSHHVAYLYSLAGAPWKSQEKLAEIMNTLYTDKPDGLCGNEDMGQMSSWYIFSAMGFYPVNPCSGKYVFGTPLLDEVTLHLYNGKSFTIKARNLSDKNIYINKIKLNNKEYTKGYLLHSDIIKGGTIEFIMGDKRGIPYQWDEVAPIKQ